jgi:NAD(P)-dependent dehydrogenase (short-subunit alcohol dehydrogenase family)
VDLQLGGKVVVITGGAKGIGAAIARTCAQEGAVPVILDRDKEAGEALSNELRGKGDARGAEFLEIDLCSASSCRDAIDRVAKTHGRIDALVNNAGINDGVGLERGTPEQFVSSLERNLLHYYNMAHFALPFLKDARGAVINIGSKTAVTGQGGTSGYVAAKGAILALTREWAAELLPFHIRVNAVIPAEVMTPLYRQWLSTFPNPEEKRQKIVAKIPLGQRMTEANEIASMVVFLLSSQASHITGQHLYVDGGYVHLDRALT